MSPTEPSILSGSATGPRGPRPVWPRALAVVGVAAVGGLLAGAVWGLSGRSSGAPSASPSGSPTPSASPSRPNSSPSRSTSSPSSSASSSGPAASTPPAAPAGNALSSNGWTVSNYTTPNVDGHLTVKATVRHSGTTAATGNLTIFVYVGGNLVATTRAQLTSPVPASGTPVTFTSTDRWVPGSKVLVLATG